MKTIIRNLFFVSLLFSVIPLSKAQTINWSAHDHFDKNIRLYSGLDYGITYGFQFGKIIKTPNITWGPFMDFSLPLGNNLIDDYKLKIGTTAKLFQYNHWITSFDISIINRRNRNPFVSMQSFGSESGIHFGYYKQRWFANIHFSTDNSLITHLNHSKAYKSNYSGVKDGWYENTSNNQLLGFNTGFSFKSIDITLSSGLIRTDTFNSSTTLPIYMKLGINQRF